MRKQSINAAVGFSKVFAVALVVISSTAGAAKKRRKSHLYNFLDMTSLQSVGGEGFLTNPIETWELFR